MKKIQPCILAFLAGSVLLTSASFSVIAAEVSAASDITHKPSFDGNIHNNTLAISPDEKMAVVARSGRPEVIVYDLDSGKVRDVLTNYITPRNIVFAPDGKTFFVSDSSLGLVVRIDARTLKMVTQYAIGPGAFGTVLNKDGKTLYINNQASNSVVSLNTETGVANAVITGFSQPRQGVRLSPDGKTLFVTNFLGDKITLVDTASNQILNEIIGFNKIRAISVTADGRTLFAANSGSNTIAVVDIATRKITATIPVGQQPYGAALSPDGKFIYSGNLADNSVSVIDVAALNVVATIKGFDEPRQAIAFTRDNRYAYVLNKDLSLSRIERSTQHVVSTIKI